MSTPPTDAGSPEPSAPGRAAHPAAAPPVPPAGTPPADDVSRHIRGSSLLLAGRVISIALNFVTQVLTVRYLAKHEYGAFSYALSVVAIGSTFSILGMNKAIGRFLPIFIERGDRPAQAGTIALAFGNTLGLGASIIALTFALRGLLLDRVVSDPLSVGLLLVLVALVPLQGIDNLFQNLFAVLASPRAIFFRRHILTPLLRLAAVLAVMATSGSVQMLAYGYLIAGILGVAAYGLLLGQRMRQAPRVAGPRQWRIPFREVYAFCLPLITTDILWFIRTTLAVIVLESLRGTVEVADFRAVTPVAGLNLIFLDNVRLLYLPLASRLFARADTAALADFYSRTTAWISVITFPISAVCIFLAEPLTTLLFGERYREASALLAVLALGQYFDAATGVNLATLNVYARVRFIAIVNTIVSALSVALYFALAPRYGAMGIAIATSATVVLHNLVLQVGLARKTGIGRLRGPHARVYAMVLALFAILAAARAITEDPWAIAALVALLTFGLLRWSRRSLEIARTFPEFARIPGFRLLFGSSA